jgi:hypothetical protein
MEGVTMMAKLGNIKAIVATSMMVIFPLTTPNAKAVVHAANAFEEDGDPTYDHDGVPGKNGYVLWADDDDHIISNPMGYTVDPGYTLEIPALNYFKGDPAENVIEFQGMGNRMDVYGTLITNMGPPPPAPPQWTAFISGGVTGWNGLYFHPGSQGAFWHVLIQDSLNGIVMEPGSSLISSGVQGCRFEGIKNYGMQMDGVTGSTIIGGNTNFYALGAPVASGTGLIVKNGTLSIELGVTFNSHGPGLPSLHIVNSDVYLDQIQFFGNNQPGYSVLVEGASDGTVLDGCGFQLGIAGNHYIRCDGSSILIENSTFDFKNGQLSVIANDDALGTAHPILRNPDPPGTTFDNSTMNATGGSSVTLQWYLDVYVIDADGNPIGNSQVNVTAPYGTDSKKTPQSPPFPPSEKGWAKWFICTELIVYSTSVTNYNPFNVSAENNSMMGYAFPMLTMNMSKMITIIVPFNPIPNLRPIVSWLTTPVGMQTGFITINYMLFDPDAYDNGTLMVHVYHSRDNITFWPSTQEGGDNTLDMFSNTSYTFIWNSGLDEGLMNNDTAWMLIVPSDGGGDGPSSKTGGFQVDNAPPDLVSMPTVDVTNTTAIINWTVGEPANASVKYGLGGVMTDLQTGSIGTTNQSVTLTGLLPGRNYSYIVYSIDIYGHDFNTSEFPDSPFPFETEIHILLYKGWNMISIPINTDGDLNVLNSIAGQYDAVQVYDVNNSNDPWKHYKMGKPYGNDLSSTPVPTYGGRGLWILMKNDAVLIPEHRDPTANPLYPGYTPIKLEPGWNFVGYPSMTTLAIDIALTGVQYDMVQTYDVITHQWLSYDPGSYSTDTLTQMETGRGYWIHCTAISTWYVDYL